MPLNGQGASDLLGGMTSRTPSSLKWLIDIRARLAGEIKKVEASTARAQNLLEELKRLQVELSAVDITLGLHDIKVELDAIQPVSSPTVRINAPYGALTKNILTCVRLHLDQGVRTSSVVAFVAARLADPDAPPQDIRQLRHAISHRLRGLKEEGVLENHNPKVKCGEGLWTIVKPSP